MLPGVDASPSFRARGSAMATPLYSNPLLLARSTSLQTLLNSGHTLRLFVNNFIPTPSTPLSSFTEASFPGYAGISLAGQFAGPTLVQDGQYMLTTPVLTFACTGLPGQTIYGWYVDDGTNMVACQLLTTPFPITQGGTYPVLLRPQEISQSILS